MEGGGGQMEEGGQLQGSELFHPKFHACELSGQRLDNEAHLQSDKRPLSLGPGLRIEGAGLNYPASTRMALPII